MENKTEESQRQLGIELAKIDQESIARGYYDIPGVIKPDPQMFLEYLKTETDPLKIAAIKGYLSCWD